MSRDCENFQKCKGFGTVGCSKCPSFQYPVWHKCPEGTLFDSSLDEPSCQPEETVKSCDDFNVWEPVPSFLQHQYETGKIFFLSIIRSRHISVVYVIILWLLKFSN